MRSPFNRLTQPQLVRFHTPSNLTKYSIFIRFIHLSTIRQPSHTLSHFPTQLYPPRTELAGADSLAHYHNTLQLYYIMFGIIACRRDSGGEREAMARGKKECWGWNRKEKTMRGNITEERKYTEGKRMIIVIKYKKAGRDNEAMWVRRGVGERYVSEEWDEKEMLMEMKLGSERGERSEKGSGSFWYWMPYLKKEDIRRVLQEPSDRRPSSSLPSHVRKINMKRYLGKCQLDD